MAAERQIDACTLEIQEIRWSVHENDADAIGTRQGLACIRRARNEVIEAAYPHPVEWRRQLAVPVGQHLDPGGLQCSGDVLGAVPVVDGCPAPQISRGAPQCSRAMARASRSGGHPARRNRRRAAAGWVEPASAPGSPAGGRSGFVVGPAWKSDANPSVNEEGAGHAHCTSTSCRVTFRPGSYPRRRLSRKGQPPRYKRRWNRLPCARTPADHQAVGRLRATLEVAPSSLASTLGNRDRAWPVRQPLRGKPTVLLRLVAGARIGPGGQNDPPNATCVSRRTPLAAS